MSQATAKTLIAKLRKMPPDSKIFVRPKYSGRIEWHQDVKVKLTGVTEMEDKSGKRNITFLI